MHFYQPVLEGVRTAPHERRQGPALVDYVDRYGGGAAVRHPTHRERQRGLAVGEVERHVARRVGESGPPTGAGRHRDPSVVRRAELDLAEGALSGTDGDLK